MEEKDIKFNIVRMENPNVSQIGITSDVDDFPDYMEVDEYVAIIANTVSKCVDKILELEDSNDDLGEYDEDDKEQQEKLEDVSAFTSEILHLVLDVINSTTRGAFKLPKEDINCCVIQFKKDEEEDDVNVPTDTYYSNGIRGLDPLRATYPLLCDTMSCLVESGVNKQDVKNTICEALDLLKLDLLNILNEM